MSKYDPEYLAAIEAEQLRVINEYIASYVPEPVAEKVRPFRKVVTLKESGRKGGGLRPRVYGVRKATYAEVRERARA